MDNILQLKSGKRFVSDDSITGIANTLVNQDMKEYEELDVQKRKLLLFKQSMVLSLKNIFGDQYSKALHDRDKNVGEMISLLSLTTARETELYELERELVESRNRLMNINAQRRGLVFDNHHRLRDKNFQDYKNLTDIMLKTQNKIAKLERDFGVVSNRLIDLENTIMQYKNKSTDAFKVLGETPAKFQKKIADIERQMSKIEFRQKQLLMQMGNQASKIHLRSTGVHVDDDDSDIENESEDDM